MKRFLAVLVVAATTGAIAQPSGFFHEDQWHKATVTYCMMALEYFRATPGISGITYGSLDCPATAERAMENILARATIAQACERGPGAPATPKPKVAYSTRDVCRAVIVHPMGDPSAPEIIFDDPTCRPGAPVAMATLITFLLAHPNPGQK